VKIAICRNRDLQWFTAALILSAVSLPLVFAQSKDRDHPTPITSPEINGFVDKTVAGDHYYYSLTAGPGELTFGLSCEAGRDTNTSVVFQLFDITGHSVFYEPCNVCCGNTWQKVSRITLARKQPLVLLTNIYDGDGGKYRVRISGPLELAVSAPASGGAPSHGKLRIEMTDGTIQEIDLTRVRRLTWEP
jgi:hypothetical protein